MTGLKHHLETRTYPIPWPGHYISGTWVAGSKSADESVSLNPSNEKPILRFSTDKGSIDSALESANANDPAVRNMQFADRLLYLKRMGQAFAENRETLVRCLEQEIGKARWEAKADVDAACRYFNWLNEHGSQVEDSLLAPAKVGTHASGDYVLNPVGVTLAYLPFSTPVTSFAFIYAGCVLAACPLVLISSTQAALCALQFANMAKDLEMRTEFLSVVFGGFKVFKANVDDPRVHAAIYTGSKEHCDQLRKQHKGYRRRQLILQSGGKNSALVHSSAAIEKPLKEFFTGHLNLLASCVRQRVEFLFFAPRPTSLLKNYHTPLAT